jgi:hypothetical protein
MTTFAQPETTFISRTRLQLAAALVSGIAIGAIGAAGLIDGRPAVADPTAQAAPAAPAVVAATDRATTSASEQYQGWYTRGQVHRPTTTAGEQYRSWYTGEE